MRVSIEHGEVKEGLVFKKTHPTVTVSVEFSAEERETLKNPHFNKYVLVPRGAPANRTASKDDADIYNLRLSSLLKNGTDTYACKSTVEAKMYEEMLRDAFKKLKAEMENASPIENKSSSFEL